MCADIKIGLEGMAKKKKSYAEPPEINFKVQAKCFELSKLTFAEREELAMLSRQNQRNGPSRETVKLKTGRECEIYGTSEVKVL